MGAVICFTDFFVDDCETVSMTASIHVHATFTVDAPIPLYMVAVEVIEVVGLDIHQLERGVEAMNNFVTEAFFNLGAIT